MMNTKKIATIAIITLLVANLGLLAFIMSKPYQPKNEIERSESDINPKQLIIKRLNFNDEQTEKFMELIKFHREEILSSDEKIRNNKEQLFSLLGEEIPNETKADSLTVVIGNLQKEIEYLHFKHFQRVKSLCNGEQTEKFNELSKDISKIFQSKKNKSRHKNKK